MAVDMEPYNIMEYLVSDVVDYTVTRLGGGEVTWHPVSTMYAELSIELSLAVNDEMPRGPIRWCHLAPR